jgi:hypothetical protein
MGQLANEACRKTPGAGELDLPDGRSRISKARLAAIGKGDVSQHLAPPQPRDDIPEEWRSRTVVSVTVAARLLSLSRQAGYDAVARGDLPAIRIGRRLVVPVVKLRRMLGELPPINEAG